MSTTQTHEEWLASLKAGDQVATQNGLRDYTIYEVTRRTKTRITINAGSGVEYRADTGRAVNAGKWDSNYIHEVTPDILAAIKRRKLESAVWSELTKLDNVNAVRALSDERLEELLAVLRKGEQA